MPLLGESVTEGTISAWLKAPGDRIAADEPLFEVSTDKVDSEVPSRFAGTLVRILADVGDTVAVGAPIAVLEVDSDDPALGAGPPQADGDVAAPATVAPADAHPAALSDVQTARPEPSQEGRPAAARRVPAPARVDERRLVPLPPRPDRPGAAARPGDPASANGQAPVPVVAAPAVPDETPPGARFVVHNAMRRVIGRRMSESLHTAAHTLA